MWSRDGQSPPPPERMDYFVDQLSDFVGHMNLRAKLLLLACLYTVSVLAPLLRGRLGGLPALTVPERIAAIESLERTTAALALYAIKTMVSMIWYEHPDNAREIGWDRQCMKS